jgi:ABC-2 type transport system permease protein
MTDFADKDEVRDGGTPSPALETSALPGREETRPWYWSVRRELWENRSIYIAPLIVSGLALLGFMMSAVGMPHRRRALLLLDPWKQRVLIEQPYDFAAMILILTAFIVGVFYCLDALHGERRERSILFWKSLPVSDLTTVLSKAIIPLAILPLLTCAVIVVTQFIIMLMTTVVLLPSGLGATTWTILPFVQMPVILLYGMIALVLWHAPIYAWALLVSGWARRAAFLWAVLPWIAVCIVEKIAFNTAQFAVFLGHRLGGSEDAFIFGRQSHGAVIPTVDQLSQLAPLKFLSSPGLWLGLIVAAIFLAAAVRLRRYRGPL